MTPEVLRYAAFTEDGRGGNPAGVVLDASCLNESEMLAVARAIGYSETAFVLPAEEVGRPAPGRYRIRFFSPHAEVAFCGHATVATAVAIAERHGPGALALGTAAGPVSVSTSLEEGRLTATLISPPTRTHPVDEILLEAVLAALHWTAADLDPNYPAHVAHAGNDHLVVAAGTAARLADLDDDFHALGDLMAGQGWTTVCLFRRSGERTYEVRNALPPGGVVEDPATGAAAAALGGYLRDLGLEAPGARLMLHQGHHIGAPSRLVVQLHPTDRRVEVAGTATRLTLSPYDDLERP